MLGRSLSRGITSQASQLIRASNYFRGSTLKRNLSLLYTEKHEWFLAIDDGKGKVGISNYAQDKLGDIVFVELPQVGETLNISDKCAEVESVKAASEIYMPVSGTVVEVNKEVTETCALINKSPEDKGWLFVVELSKPAELKSLMSAEAYEDFIKSEEV
ncbi:hypothetical protein Ciccas_011653 [Cichlidogyrus casuarinus]|uniref:Glycine cleavage system H protein n=1 Tax=Cichlidogyrus casuarinus TaxID=1844966 RepID=A0ABD2PRU7_9PLAT